jgi:hypothetical protein
VENETPVYKNPEYQPEPIIQNGTSQVDEEMVDESYYSQTDGCKRGGSEVEAEGMGQPLLDSRKMEFKKRKHLKKSKSSLSKIKKVIKTPSEDRISNDYLRYKESVEEFTKERSMKYTKEHIDIVESRTLLANVSKFCGLTESFIQDRVQQDLDTITNAISVNDRSDSEVYSNSPLKESERDNRSNRGNMSVRNSVNVARMHSDSTYSRRLRNRRNRNPGISKF